MTPKKNIHKIFIPKKIFIFLKAPKNIEIQNFEPKKMDRAYVCMKISEYPPGADDGPTLNTGLVALLFFRGTQTCTARKPYIFVIFGGGGPDPLSPPSGSAHTEDAVYLLLSNSINYILLPCYILTDNAGAFGTPQPIP